MRPKVFISHSSKDTNLARRLEKELRELDAEVWVDHSEIRGGDNLPERINEALGWCNTLLLLWSKTARDSRWVKIEWTCALTLEKQILPCLLDKTELPSVLSNTVYLSFHDSGFMEYDAAEEHVRNLNSKRFADFTDWRLPTLVEAMSLMRPTKNEKGLYIDPVFNEEQKWIWTSDEALASRAWVVDFDVGGCSRGGIGLSDGCVRAVRRGQSTL